MGSLRPIILAAMILISHQACAQSQFNMLRGVSKIKILIEDMNGADYKKCGLTQEGVRAAIMYPLSSSKIQIVDTAPYVTLYVNIGTLDNGVCSSSIQIDVNNFQPVKLEFSGDTKFAKVMLWYTGGVASGNRTSHSRLVSEFIEERIKKFVTDWNLDNR